MHLVQRGVLHQLEGRGVNLCAAEVHQLVQLLLLPLYDLRVGGHAVGQGRGAQPRKGVSEAPPPPPLHPVLWGHRGCLLCPPPKSRHPMEISWVPLGRRVLPVPAHPLTSAGVILSPRSMSSCKRVQRERRGSRQHAWLPLQAGCRQGAGTGQGGCRQHGGSDRSRVQAAHAGRVQAARGQGAGQVM